MRKILSFQNILDSAKFILALVIRIICSFLAGALTFMCLVIIFIVGFDILANHFTALLKGIGCSLAALGILAAWIWAEYYLESRKENKK